MSVLLICFNIFMWADFILKLEDSALFNNSVVWLGGAELWADIHKLSLHSSQDCFCQAVELLKLRGNGGSLKEVQLLICVPLEQSSPCWDHIWRPVTPQLNEVIMQEAIAVLARDSTPLSHWSIVHSVYYQNNNKVSPFAAPFFFSRTDNRDRKEGAGLCAVVHRCDGRIPADLYCIVKTNHCPFTQCQRVAAEAH